MDNVSIAHQPRIVEVKVQYDRCNPREVYEVIQNFFPGTSAKSWTPELVFPFIPEGADAQRWTIILRNVEYTASKPKKKARRKRTRCNLPRKSVNYAEQVTRRTTFDAINSIIIESAAGTDVLEVA